MKAARILGTFWVCFLFSCQPVSDPSRVSAFADNSPEKAGLLTARLTRIDDRIQQSIQNGEVAGTVAIIARNGVIGYHKAFGRANMAKDEAMEKSSIFRIASMSKLVTCVGALILLERGQMHMETPLKSILPEFKSMSIMKGWDDQKKHFITEKAENDVLIKHLFSHTSGIVYPIFASQGRAGYLAAGVQDGFPDMEISLEENIKRLSSLPLAHEPGEKWTYGMNMDVLGRIIEVVDGRPFSRFMEEEVFGPLDLSDTGFEVAPEDWPRVVEVYTTVDGKLEVYDQQVFDIKAPNNQAKWWTKDAEKIALGGAGILTTAYDYARFLQMLLNFGELEGTRILGRKTVELISRPLFNDFGGSSTDMGLSVWVLNSETDAYTPASIGSYGWSGYFYTSYWVDPKESLVAVIMNQVNPAKSNLNRDFINLTYASIK